jgi:malate dehydrogenase (oxaloacetate-decarboxylating)
VIAATGRSDFPNQVNNSLCFPGVFRGVLSVRATAITNEMAIAAAEELAKVAEEKGLSLDYILPSMVEWDAHARVSMATARAAIKQDIASRPITEAELTKEIDAVMTNARKSTQLLMDAGLF